MSQEGCTYKWNNQPRIITYTNPKRIVENSEVAILMKQCVQLCASDTLMQGLISRYGREAFGVMCSVDHFQEILFDYVFTGVRQSLQTYLDVLQCIENIDESIETKSLNFKNAFIQNASEVSEAFKFLALSNYKLDNSVVLSDEQQVFFDHVYNVMIERYRKKYNQAMSKVDKIKIKESCKKAICNEVQHFVDELDSKKIPSIDEAKEILDKFDEGGIKEKRQKISLQSIMESLDVMEVNTIIIHGVIRFTPEIMMLVQTLDKCGIKLVFLINYCDNLDDIYGIWKRAYEWTGCEFENVKPLNLADGREPGRSIAEVSQGRRTHTRDSAKFRKYISLTEFTDLEVRRTFQNAQANSEKRPLSKMKVQYYSVDSEKPNDILRNYFPEQFMEKPFMAYPVGQFIRGLFEMWDFDRGEIVPDFKCLKDCALIKIAHSRDDMFSILSKIEVYFNGADDLKQMMERANVLKSKLDKNRQLAEYENYLSFYDVTGIQVQAFMDFLNELNVIGEAVFGSDPMQQVEYQQKFGKLIQDISERMVEKELGDDKEKQLLSMLEESLDIAGNTPVVGSVKSLKEAMMLYLQVKQKRSNAKWIVRGFDQLDGAPLMKNHNVDSFEIAGLSMKNMTKTIDEVLPWPLKENLFTGNELQDLFSHQARIILEDRNNYLKFYLFYVSFFAEKDLIFSFFENENDEKQRPYYLLGMLGLVPIDVDKSDSAEMAKIVEKHSEQCSDVKVNIREKNIFSICPYKYFIFAVLRKRITYHTDYHIRYFLETEAARDVSKKANYKKEGIDILIEQCLNRFRDEFQFFDDAELSDIRKFIVKHVSDHPDSNDHIQKKRDFLIAAWKDMDSGVNHMNYNKAVSDVHEYLNSSKIMQSAGELPHKKVCQECCFSSFCLNNYYDKEVDV